jgi:hypothetical protein
LESGLGFAEKMHHIVIPNIAYKNVMFTISFYIIKGDITDARKKSKWFF